MKKVFSWLLGYLSIGLLIPTLAFASLGPTAPPVRTSLGNIIFPTDPSGVVQRLFGILLGLAGVIAIFLIIFSGFRLALSQGNQEKVQAARETLTAAVAGLLFIIFSAAILQIVGVNVLGLPSIGK